MARLYTLFLVCAFIPSIFGQCTYDRALKYFERSVYEFSIDLASRINLETESHFIASTLSPWSLISSLSLGASEGTLTEIKDVLKLHPHRCFNNIYFRIVKQLSGMTEGSVLEKSSALFIDDRLAVKETFKRDVEKAGGCSISVMPFDDTAIAAASINDFVSRSTHETIDEITTPNDLIDVYMIMVDAIYFRGTWKNQFPFEDTEASAFYNERKNQIGDVNLMFVSSTFNVTSLNLINAKVLELPYEGGRFSMLLFLPYDFVSVTSVLENLKKISLSSIFYIFERDGPFTVAVQIPRFKITSDIDNLKELLTDMGLRAMFERADAQFPGISDYEMYVSNFIQKADIEVTEEGTTASAVSEAGFEARMLPEQFIANKPFVYMIVDRELKIALFTGAYSKPSLY